MALRSFLIHVDEVPPERMDAAQGWSISEFRLPISGKVGSSTTVFHTRFLPGAAHKKHLHRRSDEIAFSLEGRGVIGIGTSRADVRPGHARFMPRGIEHFMYNPHPDEAVRSVGFYPGVGGLAGC